MPPFPGVDERPPDAANQTVKAPSLAEIFEQHTPFLWRALINLGVPAADAQDQCQEIMITVHRRLASFDGASLRGWLYGICVRVASDYRRSARVRREILTDTLPDAADSADLAESLDRQRNTRRLMTALEALDEPKRAAFVLFEIEELTLAEVSEAVGAPLQTVYSRIKAAREQMRRTFASHVESESKGGISEAG
ncbi:MAG TPA: sigma-70 family RNA polymerase sigma factor [Polyangiaceae bacterium]|nr:sigma-70 family RNA polymerase sigma factor [Polyangiaceae bacterium]